MDTSVVRSTVDSGRSVSQKSEFLISIFCQCLHASYMFANTRFVWVRNSNIDPKNARSSNCQLLSGTWYFPKHVVFFHGNLDTNTKYSANRTVQQMVLLLGICIGYFQVLWNSFVAKLSFAIVAAAR